VLSLDTKLSGDQVVEYEGYKVLLVGIEYFKIFDGVTVVCYDTKSGAVLYCPQVCTFLTGSKNIKEVK
jgi:hypothetical protein